MHQVLDIIPWSILCLGSAIGKQFGEVFGQKTIHLGPQDHTGQLVGGARYLEEMRRI